MKNVKDFSAWKAELEALMFCILREPVEDLPEKPLRAMYERGYSVKLAVTPAMDLTQVHWIGGVEI